MTGVTKTSMTLSWTVPENNGGCFITNYALYLKDDLGNFNQVDASDFLNKPALREHTVTFTTDDTSNSFTFYMTASN